MADLGEKEEEKATRPSMKTQNPIGPTRPRIGTTTRGPILGPMAGTPHGKDRTGQNTMVTPTRRDGKEKEKERKVGLRKERAKERPIKVFQKVVVRKAKARKEPHQLEKGQEN